jgi:hypothetical protein
MFRLWNLGIYAGLPGLRKTNDELNQDQTSKI